MNLKKDFPIFENNPWLIYFDSTASSQKPRMVIDGIKSYLENSYSNIHRWLYDIAAKSEELYDKSKKQVCEMIWANSYKEIIYTYNSTYAANFLIWSLRLSWKLKAWDKVLLSIVEHHANIVPWLILKEEIGIEIDYVDVDENYDLDMEDFNKKYDDSVKIISMTHVSNVTWQIFDLEQIWKLKRKDTLFIVDGSQSVPHFEVDVKKLNADFMFFTWHKLWADSWIWVLWGKTELLNNLKAVFSGWWSIWKVDETCFTYGILPYKFEPGTPNLSGAVSLKYAIDYIDMIWWFEKIEEIENDLVEYTLKKFNERSNIKILWSNKQQNRVWVFTFTIPNIHSHDVADIMAENNICIRAWMHCAHPFLNKMKITQASRMSLYIYNTKEEIDKFFDVLDKVRSI